MPKRTDKQSPTDGPLTVALRKAIEADPSPTFAALADRAGVSGAIISRFIRGQRGITLAIADRLAVALGLKLVSAAPRRGEAARQIDD